MIRKIIVTILAALFANQFIVLTFTEAEPNMTIVILGLLTAVTMLFRYMAAILFVEHMVEQHNARVDKK